MDGDLHTRLQRRRAPVADGEYGYSVQIDPELANPMRVRADTAPQRKQSVPEKPGSSDGDESKSKDDEADEGAEKPPMSRGRKIMYWAIGLVVLAVIVTAGVLYFLHARHFESTDDAFVDGYISQVSSQVAGRVSRLAIDDNQQVKAGQLLLQLDPRDFEIRLVQARAQRAQAAAQLTQARAQLNIQQANLDQAESQVRVSEADLGQQRADLARYRAIDPKAITRQQLDTSSAQARSAAARLDASRQAVEGARAQIEAQRAMIEAAEANLQAADVAIANAQLQLSYTTVTAPVAGRIARRTVDVGNYVNPGQALLAVVPEGLWVTANFKETQITDMRAGQPVRIEIDACPDKDIPGRVDSFQSGTGSVFSALPAENATGNYVKVVQRVPVKIVFDHATTDGRIDGCRVLPGLSVVPRVTVR